MRNFAWAAGWILGIGLMLYGQPAWAVITRLTPLQHYLENSEFIFTAKVDALDPEKPSVVLTVDEDLKGKASFRRLPINLKGDAEAAKLKHTPQLLKRLAPKLPLVVFISQRGKDHITFAYTNGTWFQVIGRDDGTGQLRWAFTHCEPYLRRTFKGTTAEMHQAVVDGLSGKKQPPGTNDKEPPGLGPEVTEEKKGAFIISLTSGPVFAVIPVLVGGPLAILGMLFPAVFGGVSGQMQRWKAALCVFSMNSTLLLIQDWFAGSLQESWWGSQAALWLVMTLVTVVGVLWAWRRQLKAASLPEAQGQPTVPARGELIALGLMSFIGVGIVGYCMLNHISLLDSPWKAVMALWSGIWVASLYVLYARRRAPRNPSPAFLPTEGVMLWGMLLAYVGLSSTTLARSPALHGAEAGEGANEAAHAPALKGVQWTFNATGKGHIDSSPLIAGDRLYVAAAHDDAFKPYGALYCLDRATGHVLWSFDNDGDMKQVFSSPCLADGKIYIGEGYHQDSSCKLFCIKADDGKKVWEFQTESHTESSPCVAGGKVFCGAGDDGLYCLDAGTGKEVWRFPGLHVDASPVVVGNRVYAGSGVGDEHKSTAIFCLDAATGKEVWRVATELPVWGSPVVAGKQVFYGVGNGDFLKSDDNPAGALLCVDAETGTEVWRYKVGDGVLVRPAVDGRHVYCGSRDQHCYCISRKTGAMVWRIRLGSPMVAAPALARCPDCGHTTAVYAVGMDGRVCCLDPITGKDRWVFDLAAHTQKQPRLFSSPAVTVSHDADGEHRRLYLGAGLQSNLTWTASLYCLEDQVEE